MARSLLEGNEEHESEEHDSGYQHKESWEPTAGAKEWVTVEGIAGLDLA